MAEDRNFIPQQSIDHDPIKEYLKATDDFYGFKPEENQEHLSCTDLIDACSQMDDNFQVNEFIKYNTDSLVNSQNDGKDKCFIFHDMGPFSRACPKSRKTKRTCIYYSISSMSKRFEIFPWKL